MARPNRNGDKGSGGSSGGSNGARKSARGKAQGEQEQGEASPPADLSESREVSEKAGDFLDELEEALADNDETLSDDEQLDAVLEENAEEFVKNYQQRGGE